MTELATTREKSEEDERLFGPEALPTLQRAAEEVAWLSGRGYDLERVTAFVAAEHALSPRQRAAVERGMCSDEQYKRHAVRELEPEDVGRRPLRIDTENVLTTVEIALAGGLLLGVVDGTIRDFVWRRGHYAPTAYTDEALTRIAKAAQGLKPSVTRWFLKRDAATTDELVRRIEAATTPWKVKTEIKVVESPAETLAKGMNVASSVSSSGLPRGPGPPGGPSRGAFLRDLHWGRSLGSRGSDERSTAEIVNEFSFTQAAIGRGSGIARAVLGSYAEKPLLRPLTGAMASHIE
jgi:hypothetical protein